MATTTSNYYLHLRSYFDQCHIPIITQNHEVQLKIYLEPSANVINQSTLTGTPLSTINFCNAICKITRLDTDMTNFKLSSLQQRPEQNIFNNLLYGTYTVLAGATSTQIVLSSIVGNISSLFFVVRPSTGLTGDAAFNFTAISSFAILDSASTNLVGGQAIVSSLALNYLNLYYCKSSYASETALSSLNNGANVYVWSFSNSPMDALITGRSLGNHKFQGNEQLQIQFVSGLATNYQVDVYAYAESILEQGFNYVKKISL